jgi:hypothetical protein
MNKIAEIYLQLNAEITNDIVDKIIEGSSKKK